MGAKVELRAHPARRWCNDYLPVGLRGLDPGRAAGGVHEHLCLDGQLRRGLRRQRHLQALPQPGRPAAAAVVLGYVDLRGRDPRRASLFGFATKNVHSVTEVDRVGAGAGLRGAERAEVALVAVQRLRVLRRHGGRHGRRAGHARGCSPALHPIWLFLLILAISSVGVGGRLPGHTAPEPTTMLQSFYRTVRPWGFWGPIFGNAAAEDPEFRAEPRFLAATCSTWPSGLVWQISMVALPIYLVIQQWDQLLLSLAVFVLSSPC